MLVPQNEGVNMPESLRSIDVLYVGAQMQAAFVSFWEAFEAYHEEIKKSGKNSPRALSLQAIAHKEQKKFVEFRQKYLTATATLPPLR